MVCVELRFLSELEDIVQRIESVVGIHLDDGDFAGAREEIIHVLLHEACHAAVASCVPWIRDLDESEHTALDEILARLLEVEIGTSLGLFVHSADEHARELAMYGIQVSVETLRSLQKQWRQQY